MHLRFVWQSTTITQQQQQQLQHLWLFVHFRARGCIFRVARCCFPRLICGFGGPHVALFGALFNAPSVQARVGSRRAIILDGLCLSPTTHPIDERASAPSSNSQLLQWEVVGLLFTMDSTLTAVPVAARSDNDGSRHPQQEGSPNHHQHKRSSSGVIDDDIAVVAVAATGANKRAKAMADPPAAAQPPPPEVFDLTQSPGDDDDGGNGGNDKKMPPQKREPTEGLTAATSETAEDEDDVQVLGSTGPNALTDFPHAREHCLVHPLAATEAQSYCPNCYCYVCDRPARDCPSWSSRSVGGNEEEEDYYRNNHCRASGSDPKWRQLWEEARAAAAPAAAVRHHHHLTVPELLDSVTRIYPQEVVPPPHVFTTHLHHYQKQSLAFLLDLETQQHPPPQRVRSGWLCSEVGMGKSAVVLALVAANPMPVDQHPSLDDVKLALRSKGKRLRVKATVVYTSVSLLGQWEDEVRKHAPSLNVVRHHSSDKMTTAEMADADIIVTAATFPWHCNTVKSFEFHRVVVDESHAIGSVTARLEYVLALQSERRLCVTATPFTTSVKDLERQIAFLRLEGEWNRWSPFEFLQRYMIRHLKSQTIHGARALTLPASTTTTRMVPMTHWERNTFHDALRRRKGQRLQAKTRLLEMNWYAALTQPLMCEDSSKIECLTKDLRAMLQSEPSMRAVVYTQFLEQQKYTKKAIQSMGIQTYTFNGSLQPQKRDRYIRAFQSLEEPGPAVFLVTIKAGSVGITLTAASHVFLLEPCIDPATCVEYTVV